ncbi:MULTISPECIES: rhodanese-like domain-containing protein [unclassified Mycolicibacterium]|uniref:sulfurtransferase n=1 Tax=unclassified Mycolicibacterium TaxID=2636767 RepID=UPI001390E36B|nr:MULTISPECIES: rhodanese-like domain-containing protein [unclassified Mycolicibacterium]
MPQPLVSVNWLAEHITEKDLVVLDGSVDLIPTPPYRVNTYTAYLYRHIPGAVYADILGDLSDPAGSFAVTRPSPERAASKFGNLGIGRSTRVVVYDADYGQYAARLWWLLKSIGHDSVAVLDGGLKKWTEEGGEIQTGQVTPLVASYSPSPRPDMWAEKKQVLSTVHGNVEATLVNAVPLLPADVSTLPDEAVTVMSTTIPSSIDVPYPSMAQRNTSMLLSAPELERYLAAVSKAKPAIVYCNSGLNAPLVGLGLLRVGVPEVKVYDGSLAEWLDDPQCPTQHRTVSIRSGWTTDAKST